MNYKSILKQNRFSLLLIAFAFPVSVITPSVCANTLEVSITQQKKSISGVVFDGGMNEPLIGANVIVKGSTNGTVTDIDGKFSLEANPNDILVISSIGFKTVEIKASEVAKGKVTLQEDSQALDEVVVVGYGVQKKVNLTGAVATVQAEKLESRATTNLSNALSGLAAGVSVSQSSGKPGSDGSSIRMRGIGTFNSSYLSPLVIVDGSEASMSSVNSDDVESISFLKDAASASIYGSRGANGVILITTKKGKKGQAPKITYSGLVTNSKMSGKAFRFEDNFAEYMEMANRWNTNRNYEAGTKYTQADIDEWREGLVKAASDPYGTDNPYGVANMLAYPSTQWVDEMFLPSTSQKHNVSVVGSSSNTNYLLSFGFLDNPGTLDNTGLKNYSGRVNVETEITKFLTVGTQTYATFQSREPGNTSFSYMFQNTPNMTPYYNGKYGVSVDGSSSNNLLATVMSRGGSYDDTRLNTTWFARVKIIDGLTAEGRYNYQTLFNEEATWSNCIDKMNFRNGELYPGTSSSQATTKRSTTRYWNRTITGTVNYNKTFGDHDLGVLLGTEQYYWNVKGFNATRTGLLDLSLPDFTAAMDLLEPTVGGTAQQDYGVISYFGRLNYAYKNRYLFEANFRRDGSSNFSKNNRYGNFPSFSAAYNMHREKYWEPIASIVNTFKLRASYGTLGNQEVPNYLFYETIPIKTNLEYIINGARPIYTQTPDLVSWDLTWEESRTLNIGADMSFLDNRLSATVEWYSRETVNMFGPSEALPAVLGKDAPKKNNASLRTNGFELTLNWKHRVNKDFSYSITGTLADAQTEVTKYNNPTGIISDKTYFKGQKLGDIWGYVTDGFFTSEEDVKKSPDQSAIHAKWNPGDMKYIDLNKDGKIDWGDNTINNPGDKKVLGNNTPRFLYGLMFAGQYKDFDFSVFFQGVGKRDVFIGSTTYFGFQGNKYFDNVHEHNMDYWREDNKDAFFARPYSTGEVSKNQQVQSRFIQNGAYLRLKNLQLGYTLPSELLQGVGIDKLRFYFSGENLLTFTKLMDGVDPEGTSGAWGDAKSYPLSLVCSFGVNLTF